jgi:probable F420-dependent oxidoreductase
MKIRIGLGLPAGLQVGTDALGRFVDDTERLGFDSLWVTERVNARTLDPVVAMTFAAARTTRIKIGASVMVLPGRNPVLLAKAMASLDQVSGGRLLPAFGLGVANAAEHQAFGVARNERARIFDEALPLMQRLWSEDRVTHHGERFHLDDVTVLPKPRQPHLDVWLGGASRAELTRCGRLGDGWLPSFCTPDTVREGIAVVNEAAAAAGRQIDPEHFGVLVPYVDGTIPEPLAAVVTARAPDARPEDAIATSRDQLRERIEAFVAVGASKFVLFPYAPADDWTDELEALTPLHALSTVTPVADATVTPVADAT